MRMLRKVIWGEKVLTWRVGKVKDGGAGRDRGGSDTEVMGAGKGVFMPRVS